MAISRTQEDLDSLKEEVFQQRAHGFAINYFAKKGIKGRSS